MEPTDPTEPRQSVHRKMMDLLARRNYSEAELRARLARGGYHEDDIENAISLAREKNWLPSAEDLATEVAENLKRKNKGQRYINEFLEARGLPPVQKNEDEELEQGLSLVRAKVLPKLANDPSLGYEEVKAKVVRFLASRGYGDAEDESSLERFAEKAWQEFRAMAAGPDAVDSIDPAFD